MAKTEHSFEEICRDIRARKFAPVYILQGEEPYFIDKITDLLLETVLTESERDFNQTIFYGADTDGTKIFNAARRYPMMSEYQLVVVREAQLVRDIELLANYVKNPLKSTVLVINYNYKTLNGHKALAVAAEKTGLVFNSKKLRDSSMPAFITGILKERGLSIEPKGTQMLADYLGNDLERLCKDLDKLAVLLPDNGPKRITAEMIENNVGISKEYNNYELLNALAVKDVLKANRIAKYFEMNPKANPIQMTLPVLFNYFAGLMICFYEKNKSDANLMAALGLHSSWQLRNYQTGLRNFKPMKVFALIREIRLADACSKGIGNADMSDADILSELLYKILH
ncbi:MAG: DNA polymerase III subunit delta [Tannerella sp.]|jgi:DNA polymerase-3 subunit delta|nr:DNA polymerase III subunit delta [Tannerella sp.]